MLSQLVQPLGIATFVMLVITSFLGIARWKLHWFWLKASWHYACAILTLLLGAVHGTIVMLLG